MRISDVRKPRRFLPDAGIFVIFSILSFFIFNLASPIVQSNATDATASDGSAAYVASISTNDTVSMYISPSNSQTTSTGTNVITYTNTCPYGFDVTMSSSTANTNLTRTGSDSGIKAIPTISSGTALADNTWGFSTNNGSTYSAIPTVSNPINIISTSVATTNPTTFNVVYGAKVDFTIPSGTYSNVMVYTVSAKPQCITYETTWDYNGGTANPSGTYPSSINYGAGIDLTTLTPTKNGYTFAGWSNGTDTFTGSETSADLNPSNSVSVTLTAQWTPIDYTISYTLNSGSLPSGTTNPSTYTIESNAITLNNPTRAGYNFKGWSGTGLTGDSNTTVTIAKGSTGNRSYTANWTAKTITLTLDGQSATTAGTTAAYFKYATATYYSNSDCTTQLTDNKITVPARNGYSFGGYYTGTNGTGTIYINSSGAFVNNAHTAITSDRTLYAKWTPKVYSIAYDLNNGTAGAEAPTSGTFDTVIEISNPTRTGYTFAGWTATGLTVDTAKYGTTSSTVTTAWSNGATPVTATFFKNLRKWSGDTVTLTATWTANDVNYQVKHYIHDLGTNTYTQSGSTETKTAKADSTITLANQKKTIAGFTYVDGYTTGGTTKPTSGAVTTTTVLPDGTRVISLYYRRNYLYVRYHVNGGYQGLDHNEAYGMSGSLATHDGSDTNFFRGVYNSKVTGINTTTYAESSNDGLHNYNGGLKFIKDGYVGKSGAEWNTAADGTGTGYNQDTATYNANTFAGVDLSTGDQIATVYIDWVPKNYSITYNLNGGSISGQRTTYNIETTAFSIPTPTRTGYTFAGWTEKITNLTWRKGQVNNVTGVIEMDSSYPDSYYTDLIRLRAGETYRLSGYGNNKSMRWRIFDTSGNYIGNGSNTNAYTPSSDCYVRIVYYMGAAAEEMSGTVMTVTTNNTSITVPTGSTENRSYTANWTDLTAPTKPTVIAKFVDDDTEYTSGTWTNREVYTVTTTTENGSGLQSIDFSTNNGTSWTSRANSQTGPTYTLNETWTISHNLVVSPIFRAVDNSNNTSASSDSITIKYDTEGPTNLQVTNSSNGNWTNGNVTITLTGTDAQSGINRWEWYENGAWTTRALTTDATTKAGTITYTAERNTTIRFRAVDNVGNVSDEITTVVKIDKGRPEVTIARTDYNTFSWSATDGNGVTGYAITNSSSTPTSWTTTGTLDSGSVDIDGAKTYYVWTKDAAGNINTATSIQSYTLSRTQGTGTTLNLRVDTEAATGGTAISAATTYVLNGTKVYAAASLKTGYQDLSLTTTGITLSSNKGTISGNASVASSATATSYTISYTLNSGSLPSGTTNPSTYTIESNAITLNNPTRAGYNFKGWSGTGLTGDSNTTVTIAKGSTGNRSYTANWTAKTITLTLDGQSATTAGTTAAYFKYATATYYSNSDCTTQLTDNKITVPARNGYSFGGYYTGTNGTGTIYINSSGAFVNNPHTAITSNKTLYAKWTPKTITLTLDGQSATTAGTTAAYFKYATATYYSNSDCTTQLTNNKITVPTKTGYTFGGYYTETNGGGTQYINASGAFTNNPHTALSSNKTLYAKWTVNTYTITYDYNGLKNYAIPRTANGTVTKNDFNGNENQTFYLASLFTDELTATDKIRITFNVSYSSLTAASGQTARMRVQASGDSTVWNPGLGSCAWEQWTGSGSVSFECIISLSTDNLLNKYFNLGIRADYYQSGSLSISNVKVVRATTTTSSKTYGQQLGTLPSPVETGYTLEGWYDAPTGGNKISSTTTVPAGDTTYYAHWTANTYTIAYAGMDGATFGTSHPTSGTYGTDVLINNPTKSGYTFTGWSTSTSAGLSTITAVRGTTSSSASTTYPVATTGTTANPYTLWDGSKTTNTYFRNLRKEAGTVTLTANWTINSYDLTINPNSGRYKNVTTNTVVTQPFNTYYGLGQAIRTGYNFSSWTKSGSGQLLRGNASGKGQVVSTQFTEQEKLASDGSPYTNYSYSNLTPESATYPRIKYPHYSFTVGHTYRITLEVRVNTLSGINSIDLRHACIENDWKSTGRVYMSLPASTVGQGWKTYTMDRTWTSATIDANNQTGVTVDPLFEIYTSIAAGNTASVDFDIRNIRIEDTTNSTQITTDSYGGYVYKYGAGNGTVTANWSVINYAISYNLNSGSLPSGTTNPTSYNVASSAININNPTRSGYTFAGWTEKITNLTWNKGFIHTPAGSLVPYYDVYPDAYYTDMIRLKSGETYTLSGYGSYAASNIRWRIYDTNGAFVENGSNTNTYTATSDCYVRILYFRGPTSEQMSGSVITVSGNKTAATIPTGSTGNRSYTANWTSNKYQVRYMANGGTQLQNSNLVAKYDGYKNTAGGHNINAATWRDLTGQGRHGAITDGTWGTDYLEFNGTSTGVILSEMNSGTQTIETTFSISETPSEFGYLVGNVEAGGGGIGVTTARKIRAGFYIGSDYRWITSNTTIELGKIYHIAVTYDGSTVRLYINGVEEEGSISISGTIGTPINSTAMALGCNPSGSNCGTQYFKGKIYNAAIFNTALTAAQVANDGGKEVTYGGTYGTLPNAALAGYTFDGWYTAASGGTKITSSSTVSTAGDHVLYAHFAYTATPTITVKDHDTFSYVGTGGVSYYISTSSTTPTITGSSSTFALDTWTTATTTNNLSLAANQTYYVWVKTAATGGTMSPNYATIVTRAVTRSVGTGSSLTTKYDSSTGTSFTSSPVYVLNGSKVYATASANSGYSNPSVTVSAGTLSSNVVTINANTTVTSSATLVNYTISYNLNSGSLPSGTSNPSTYTILSGNITLNNPTRSGYTFTGWSGTGISGTSTSVTIPTGSTGNRSYTANWTQNAPVTPTMQGFNCNDLGIDETTVLQDSRDGNNYTVLRARNGTCWMTSGLRISGMAINGTDGKSNLSRNTIFTIPASNASNFSTGQGAVLTNTYGTFYNFYAATAGGGGSAAVGDICPKNWKLPNSSTGELGYFASEAAGGGYGNTMNFSLSGYVNSSGVHTGLNQTGGYWSSTAIDSTNAYYLEINSQFYGISSTLRSQGRQVQCMWSGS